MKTLGLILIFVFVFGLILLPISKLRLNPRQKLIAKLRQQAASHHLQVQFAILKHPELVLETQQNIAYSLLLSAAELKTLKLGENYWQWFRNTSTLSASVNARQWIEAASNNAAYQHLWNKQFYALLNTLPSDVHTLEIKDGRISCHWFEHGSYEDVSQIALSLNQLKSWLQVNANIVDAWSKE